MGIAPRGVSIMELYRWYRENKLLVNRRYQRKLVWTLYEKKALINSILLGYPIPLILLAKHVKDSNIYEIIDGTQRLNAIFGFIENQFSVIWDNEKAYFNIEEFPFAKIQAEKGLFMPVAKSENFLSPELISKFLEYQIPVSIYDASSEEEINEIFRRINAFGKHLSPQEVRQAGVTTKFAEIVRELSSEFRGDVSNDILPLTKMPEISIDSRRLGLGYGVLAENTFWCQQGILNVQQLRDSLDEQLVADIVLSIALNNPFPASKEEFDKYYGKGEVDKSEDIEVAINRYGYENLKNDLKTVFSIIKDMMETYFPDMSLKNILNPNAGANPVKEPFYTLFMAFYELIIKEGKDPFNYEEIINAAADLSSKIKSASHYVRSTDRRKNIDLCKGLISSYFKDSSTMGVRSGALALDFENHLHRAKVESSSYEFKQGLFSLEEPRKFNKKALEKILQNIDALANIGINRVGYLFIGVSDKEEDTRKIEILDNLSSVPRIFEFGIVGLEREAKLKEVSLDDYIGYIIQKIKESALPENLKRQVISDATPITYHGYTVLMIIVKSLESPVWYGEKLYIRDGASCREAKGKEIEGVYALFTQR